MNLSTYNEEHPTTFVVRLTASHESMPWSDTAKLFDFHILDKYSAGDLRRVENAVEKNLQYRQTLVRFQITNGIAWEYEGKNLVNVIDDFVKLLPSDSLQKLNELGADLDVSVGLFVPYGVCHHYPSELLLALGKLSISLTIDYYSGPGGDIRTGANV